MAARPTQDAITINLLQALAQSQTVSIDSLQKLNKRLDDDVVEHTKISTTLRDQVRSLTTQLDELQKRFDAVCVNTEQDDSTDNIL